VYNTYRICDIQEYQGLRWIYDECEQQQLLLHLLTISKRSVLCCLRRRFCAWNETGGNPALNLVGLLGPLYLPPALLVTSGVIESTRFVVIIKVVVLPFGVSHSLNCLLFLFSFSKLVYCAFFVVVFVFIFFFFFFCFFFLSVYIFFKMKFAAVCVTMLVLVACVSANILGPRDLLVDREKIPNEYDMVSFASPEDKVTFIFALHQQNLDKLEAKFWAVCTPGSSEYQQFMTEEEILDLIAPPQEQHQAVVQWLKMAGVQDIVDHRDAIKVTTTVAVAENLFNAKFFVFQHKKSTAHRIVRALGAVTLPRAMKQNVYMVSGVSDFPPVGKDLRRVKPEFGTEAVVPQTLYSQYNFPSTIDGKGCSQGVAEFGAGQDFSASDLSQFASQCNVSIPALDQSHIVNPLPPSGVEGTLDIQYVASTGTGATNWYWTEQNWLYDFATSFFQATNKPEVVSISYGWSELQQCQLTNECSILGVDSEQYVARTNVEFQKIGLNGVSLLCASGDSGANGRSDPTCTTPKLLPSYPAASPYITAVGATQLNTGCSALSNGPPVCNTGSYSCCASGEEQAVSYSEAQFASGGGFSNYAAQPSYQQAAVSAYLSSGVELPPSSYFNASNRGFPDVASLGHNVLINMAQEGGFIPVGGTSASSPSFAGVVSLLNKVSKQKSGKPLGFLNPLLYKMAAADSSTFGDITKGDNICTEQGCSSGCKGYKAAAGWDPVTGLGTPRPQSMIAYVNREL
jgi:subtilase family serine protease